MSITSNSAVILLSIPQFLPVSTQLSGFSADDIFDTDEIDMSDTIMGADGRLSGGLVRAMTPWNITFQADSPSVATFESWDAIQQSVGEVFPAQAVVTLISIGVSFQMTKGFLVRGKRMPDAKKVLQPRKFRVHWQNVISIPVGIAG